MKRRVIAVLLSLSVAVTAVPAMGSAVDAGEVPVVEAAEVVTPEEALAEEAPVVEESADIVDADAAVVEDTAEVTEEPAAEVETIAADFTDGLSDAEVPEVAADTTNNKAKIAKVTITLTGDDEDPKTVSGKDLSSADDEENAEDSKLTYDFDPRRVKDGMIPAIKISYSSEGPDDIALNKEELTAGVDYNLEIKNATKAGKAYIKITFGGDYTNCGEKYISYTIKPVDLAIAEGDNRLTVTYAEKGQESQADGTIFTYNGQKQVPSEIKVIYRGTELKLGTDYKVEEPTDAVKASKDKDDVKQVKITGVDDSNFAGTVLIKYRIAKADSKNVKLPENLVLYQDKEGGDSTIETVLKKYVLDGFTNEAVTLASNGTMTIKIYKLVDGKKDAVANSTPLSELDGEAYTYEVVADGLDNFTKLETPLVGTFTIADKISVEDLVDDVLANLKKVDREKEYTGGDVLSEFKSGIEGKLKSYTSTPDTSISSKVKITLKTDGKQEIIDRGTYTLVISGTGEWQAAFSDREVTVEVTPRQMYNDENAGFVDDITCTVATLNGRGNGTYVGCTPKIELKWSQPSYKGVGTEYVLKQGTDFVITKGSETFKSDKDKKINKIETVTVEAVEGGNFTSKAPIKVAMKSVDSKIDLSESNPYVHAYVKKIAGQNLTGEDAFAAPEGLDLTWDGKARDITQNNICVWVEDPDGSKTVLEAKDFDVINTSDAKSDCVTACVGNKHAFAGEHKVVIKAKPESAEYTGDRTVTFTITGKEFGEDYQADAVIGTIVVNHTVKAPEKYLEVVSKKDGYTTLKQGVDFTVKYTYDADPEHDNTGKDYYNVDDPGNAVFKKAGAWTMTISPVASSTKTNGYTGTIKVPFQVSPQEFTEWTQKVDTNGGKNGNVEVTVSSGTIAWPGRAVTAEDIKSKLTLTNKITGASTTAMTYGKDYEIVSLADNDKIGEMSVTLRGMGDWDNKTITAKIKVTAVSLKDSTVGLKDGMKGYQGGTFELAPEDVVVTVGSVTVDPSEYTVKVEDKDADGIYEPGDTVNYWVETAGNHYTDKSDKASFEIEAADISNESIFTVKYNPVRLFYAKSGKEVPASEYTVDNVNGKPGDTVTFTANASSKVLKGTRTVTIEAAEIDASSIVLDKDSYEYAGSPVEPKIVSVKDTNGDELTAADYDVSYRNNNAAGTGTVVLTPVEPRVTGKAATKTFTITAAAAGEKTSIANADVKAYDALYDGTAKKANAVVVALGGKTLVEGTDYTVSYTDAGAGSLTAKVGKKTVTVTGIGAYTGTAVSSYVVDPAQVKMIRARSGAGRARIFMEAMEGVKYQVQYRVKDTAKWKTAGTFSVADPEGKGLLVKGLKAGKKYQFHVRAVVTVDGTTIRGSWSKVKTTPYKVK